MKNILTTTFLLVLTLSLTASSQWAEKKVYSPFKSPVKTSATSNLWGSHGVAVDPEGKIWVAPYDATDTLTLGSSANLKRREIFVFKPDGTPASFSPVKIILGDSLNNNNSGRGIASDYQGNILYSSFNRVFKINYKTGVGISKVDLTAKFSGNSVTAAASDSSGNIFVARVGNKNTPLLILDPNLAFVANAVDSIKSGSFARTLVVSGNGTRVYLPEFDAYRTFVYRNDNGPGFGIYPLVDTLAIGMQTEAIAWQPRKAKAPILWVSSGCRNNPPSDSLAKVYYGRTWAKNSWYGFDVTTKQVVDSIKWGATFANNPTFDDTVTIGWGDTRPRGIAFSAAGDTAYVTMYMADSNSVKLFVKTPTSVEPVPSAGIATNYALDQNYPNPFNPSTEIKFTLEKPGFTTLRVYDIVGREVATLVSENLMAGSFKATFDAEKLSSGTYVYELRSGDVRLAKKMVLLK